jgi:hypothetical protein
VGNNDSILAAMLFYPQSLSPSTKPELKRLMNKHKEFKKLSIIHMKDIVKAISETKTTEDIIAIPFGKIELIFKWDESSWCWVMQNEIKNVEA